VKNSRRRRLDNQLTADVSERSRRHLKVKHDKIESEGKKPGYVEAGVKLFGIPIKKVWEFSVENEMSRKGTFPKNPFTGAELPFFRRDAQDRQRLGKQAQNAHMPKSDKKGAAAAGTEEFKRQAYYQPAVAVRYRRSDENENKVGDIFGFLCREANKAKNECKNAGSVIGKHKAYTDLDDSGRYCPMIPKDESGCNLHTTKAECLDRKLTEAASPQWPAGEHHCTWYNERCIDDKTSTTTAVSIAN
jgi:hypothetical protein